LDVAVISSLTSFSIPSGKILSGRTEHSYRAFDLPPPQRLILFRTFLI
jgi:hypothetical protein